MSKTKHSFVVSARVSIQQKNAILEAGEGDMTQGLRALADRYIDEYRIERVITDTVRRELEDHKTQIQTLREELREGIDGAVKRIGRGVAGLLQKHFSGE